MTKKRLLCLLLIMFSCLLVSCGLRRENREYGDFLYQYTSDDMGKSCITIMGLSEQGKQKETIVTPTEINGKLVKCFGLNIHMRTKGYIESENLKNIYIHGQIEKYENEDCFGELTDRFGKIRDITIFLGVSREKLWMHLPTMLNRVYVAKEEFYETHDDEYYSRYEEGVKNNIDYYTKIKFANVIYYYNYGKKTTFFVDDCDGTVVNVIPPEPFREGYKFLGWYKEPECINKWDFEKDIVPAKEYDKNGEYVLKETKLFAKWEEE